MTDVVEAPDGNQFNVEVGNLELNLAKNDALDPYEIVSYPMGKAEVVIFDVDGTLYQNPSYERAIAVREAVEVANQLNMGFSSNEDAYDWFKNQKAVIGQELDLGRSARATEAVLQMGLDKEWWDKMRVDICEDVDAADYLSEDSRVIGMVDKLETDGKRFVFASNSPTDRVRNVLKALGFGEDRVERMAIHGPDTLGYAKPSLEYYQTLGNQVAAQFDVSPGNCLVIGDDPVNDAGAASEAGMGGIRIHTVDQVVEAVDLVFESSDVTVHEIMEGMMPLPGEVKVVGVTGRAGAGKTTTAGELVAAYEAAGFDAHLLSLDAFFSRSSKDRAAWLAEEGITDEERSRREDQDNWWDFDAATDAIQTLRKGQYLHLSGIYDRSQGGELVGELLIAIDPSRSGTVIVFEGVGIPRVAGIDNMIYVNAHGGVRRGRVLERDIERRGEESARKRWGITESYENRLFEEVSQSNIELTVVDNSNPGELVFMGSKIPSK